MQTFEIGGKPYEVLLGWNAVQRLEEMFHEPIRFFCERMLEIEYDEAGNEKPHSPLRGTAGMTHMAALFWAGLETARIKTRSRKEPYTLEEVGELIDESTPRVFFREIFPQISVLMAESFPPLKPEKPGAADGNGNGKAPAPDPR